MAQPWPPRSDINNDKLYSERFIESTICGWCPQSLGPGWPLRYILLLPRLPCPQFVNYFTKLQIVALLLYLTWRNVVQILWVYRMVLIAGCDWNICRCRFDPLIEHLSIVHLSIELIETFADANSTHWHLHPWGEGGLGTGCLSYMKSRCSMRRKGNDIRDACSFADMSGMGFSQLPRLTWSGSGNLTRWDCDWMDLWMLVC